MDPAGMLEAMAQVAVTMAGFAGVVVAFGPRAPHEWSIVDRFRLQLLLTTSIVPLAQCLVALLLLSTGLATSTVWALSSLVAAATFVLNAIAARAFARFPRDALLASRARTRLFHAMSALAFGVMLLQLWNVAVLRAFWPFFAAIVASIGVSTLQFALMILARRDPSSQG